MNAALISDKCDRDQNEHHDQNDALFVFREFENSEQAFHLVRRNFGICGHHFFPLGVLQSHHSDPAVAGEESQIIFVARSPNQIARDVSLRST